MSAESDQYDRLDDLAHKSCDVGLDDAEVQELQTLLGASDAAAKRYIEMLQAWNELLNWAEDDGDQAAGAVERSDESRLVTPAPKHRTFFKSIWTQFGALAAMIALAFSIGVSVGGRFAGDRVAVLTPTEQQGPADAAEPQAAPEAPLAAYIARVVEVSEDAQWGDCKPREFLLRLGRGERVDLTAGEARIEFASGASVILHGPAAFEPLAGDAGRLLAGRLTGRAEDGNFRLLTSVAEVIDLGTEFGVEIDAEKGAKVCVFDGEVDVAVGAGDANGTGGGPVRLSEGMAVRVGPDGTVQDVADINRDNFKRKLTRRRDPEKDKPLDVSLVDVVAGGRGLRDRLAGAIDTRTGGWDNELILEQEANRHRDGTAQYLLSKTSPLIDGIFVPIREAGDTTIDSTGRTFNFGGTAGTTWGPIWSRRHAANLRASVQSVGDFWGTQTLDGILEVVEESRIGVVGLHANAGLTIDLRAVRMQAGRAIRGFHTDVTNLDNSKSRPPQYAVDYRPSVDFWVLIDGSVKHELRDYGRDDGRQTVEVLIEPEDRFLTLVSTDAGNSFSFDHLVLIDPRLIAESE